MRSSVRCLTILAIAALVPRASSAGPEGCTNPVGIWTRTYDPASVYDVTVAATGAVHLTGNFSGSADFDPSAGVDVRSSMHADIFVTKLNADGSYAWTRTLGGADSDGGSGIATDPDGNVWVAGAFQLTVDFDPSEGRDEQTSLGGYDGFVSKFNVDGAYETTWVIASGMDDAGVGTVAIDIAGNVIVVGAFWGTADFDPTEGVDIRGAGEEGYDVFVTKLRSDGSYFWTRTWGRDIYYDIADRLRVDRDGNVLVYGHFSGTVDFDPGEGVDLHTGTLPDTLFVTKLHADGSYGWTHVLQVRATETYDPIELDANGDVWIAGGFRNYVGAVDFDPTPEGADERFTEGPNDVFVSKWHNDGSYAWTRTFAGHGTGYGVAPDTDGGVVVTGKFAGSMDFDPGPGVDERMADPYGNAFITKLLADGSYGWTRSIDGPNNEYGHFLDLAPDGGLIVGGAFYGEFAYLGAPDFDPGCGVDERESNSLDAFITKLGCVQAMADTDGDGDVDLADAAKFQNCFSGPSPSVCPGGCYQLDFDADDDLDLDDFRAFQDTFAAP